MELDAFVGHVAGHPAAEELRHGDEVGGVHAVDPLLYAGPQELAGGIGTALYTTVAGLIVGILALVFHGYLQARVDSQVAELEEASLRIVDQLHGESS